MSAVKPLLNTAGSDTLIVLESCHSDQAQIELSKHLQKNPHFAQGKVIEALVAGTSTPAVGSCQFTKALMSGLRQGSATTTMLEQRMRLYLNEKGCSNMPHAFTLTVTHPLLIGKNLSVLHQ